MAGRKRAERWTSASAGDGWRARRAARRLLDAAARGDEAAFGGVVRIAGTSDHRLRDQARDAVASRWAETRAEDLRRIVLDTESVALEGEARLLTLALLDRLDAWPPDEAGRAPDLLADPDPDVRDRAAAACRTAAGPLCRELWLSGPAPGTPLYTALLANPEPPPEEELNVLWRRWLDAHDPELQGALLRWNRPASDPEFAPVTVIAVTRDRDVLLEPANRRSLLGVLGRRDDHPIARMAVERIAGLGVPDLVDEACERALERPSLVPHCKRHGLVPGDPVRRAVFLLATGELGQYRSLDPDGGLLALAYAAAGKDERARVRAAMAAAGDLDLVRVLVGDDRRTRIAAMPDEEARYLAEQLARRGAWSELWAFVRDVPVPLGAGLFRLFDGWAPRDDHDRRLFEAFRETPAEVAERGLRELRALADSSRVSASVRFGTECGGPVAGVSFAPDGRSLAVAGPGASVRVLDTGSGDLVARYDGFAAPVGCVLHVGDGTVIAGERADREDAPCRLLRCADGRTEVLRTGPGSVTSLARAGDGGRFVAGLRTGEVLHGDAAGVGVLYRAPTADDRPRAVAVDPGTGHLALAGRRVRLVDPETGRTFTYDRGGRPARLAFAAAGLLACGYDTGEVVLLRLSGGTLLRPPGTRVDGLGGLGVRPGTGEPVVVDGRGDLHVLDGAELTTVGGRRAPAPAAPTGLAVSPVGDLVAVAGAGGRVDLFDLADLPVTDLPDLIARPVADLLPRHLGPVGAIGRDPALGPDATALVRLVRLCLEHRFRFDVEIGEAVRLPAGEHDIGL
ncbi:WD40 repeat domain-containing protein [Actinomadura sp. WMMB 499]|uniref:WD40 repeat domain-containing protein n=1 Tax=Actinomadura sp. WMMB 499 TaxID=1219491 RepID=UPI0012494168|nr:hypothetical protein [Actinomadura sp. WMMB 499]QFG21478.1 hypothetical protein F7P10_10390 [Actinomadura sp. WMMB 499]